LKFVSVAFFAIRVILPDAKETNFGIESLSFNLPFFSLLSLKFVSVAFFAIRVILPDAKETNFGIESLSFNPNFSFSNASTRGFLWFQYGFLNP